MRSNSLIRSACFVGLGVLLLAAGGCAANDVCATNADCTPPHVCLQGVCQNPPDAGMNTAGDASTGGCTSNAACSGTSPICDLNTGACTACLPDKDTCPTGQVCAASGTEFVCTTGCKTVADCPVAPANARATCTNEMCGIACTIAQQMPCSGACVDLDSDSANCGACGHTCDPMTQHCSGGQCVCLNASLQSCGSYCANTQSDGANCGSCGHRCSSPDVCNDGQCTDPCTLQGLTDCDGTGQNCVDLNSDPNHCGGCDLVCSVTHADVASCSGQGTCNITCNSDFPTLCAHEEACVDTTSDVNNCGGCGNQCNAGESCCNSKCVNPQTDDNNCGMCGNECSLVDTCCSGMCHVGALGHCL